MTILLRRVSEFSALTLALALSACPDATAGGATGGGSSTTGGSTSTGGVSATSGGAVTIGGSGGAIANGGASNAGAPANGGNAGAPSAGTSSGGSCAAVPVPLAGAGRELHVTTTGNDGEADGSATLPYASLSAAVL